MRYYFYHVSIATHTFIDNFGRRIHNDLIYFCISACYLCLFPYIFYFPSVFSIDYILFIDYIYSITILRFVHIPVWFVLEV